MYTNPLPYLAAAFLVSPAGVYKIAATHLASQPVSQLLPTLLAVCGEKGCWELVIYEMDGLHIPPPLAVKVFPTEGRGLTAEKGIVAGQEVIRSKAFASVVAAEVFDRFCASCARPTK